MGTSADIAFGDELSELPTVLPSPFGGAAPGADMPSEGESMSPPGPSVATMNGELVFSFGRLRMVRGREAIRQSAECRLRTFRGEWFLDANLGVPWVERVLGRKASAAPVRAIVREELLAIQGVVGLRSLNVRFDRATRTMAIDFILQTATGDVAGSVAA